MMYFFFFVVNVKSLHRRLCTVLCMARTCLHAGRVVVMDHQHEEGAGQLAMIGRGVGSDMAACMWLVTRGCTYEVKFLLQYYWVRGGFRRSNYYCPVRFQY
jgi:hypothetical protein